VAHTCRVPACMRSEGSVRHQKALKDSSPHTYRTNYPAAPNLNQLGWPSRSIGAPATVISFRAAASHFTVKLTEVRTVPVSSVTSTRQLPAVTVLVLQVRVEG
jgi:hypothetical protein